jgi:hypothetical protein
MSHQQWQTIERSLTGLSHRDKIDLAERLVHESRVEAIAGTPASRPEFPSITLEGEPFSNTMIRERR